MESLSELNGLITSAPIQQVSISPAEPLLNWLKRKSRIYVCGVHDHHSLIEYLEAKEWKHDYIVINGADGKCLHVIQAIGLWLFLYDHHSDLPRLVIIGNLDFSLPSYANFSIYEQRRKYNTTIRYETGENWYTILKREEELLQKDSILLVIVPTERDAQEYNSRIKTSSAWPSPVPKRGIYVLPGEMDSKMWIGNVQTIIDFGLEVQKRLGAIGDEENIIVHCDQERIQSRFEWLGYDRDGLHIRLFNPEDIPKINNPLPAERRSIYHLVSYFRNLTPKYESYLPLVPKKRLQNALRLLDRLDIPLSLLDLPLPPLGIKLIENRLRNTLPISGAVFIACMMSRVDKIVSDYTLIVPLRTPLHTYFSLCKSYYESLDRLEWVRERPYVNGNILNEIVTLHEECMERLSPSEEEDTPVFSRSLKASVRNTFQDLRHKEGSVYERGKEWLVDFRASTRRQPQWLTALAWIKFDPQPILYLWC